ncbi:MAG: hypothetical protein RIE77_09210 [Phycisphaerales bacterium]|jgi:hypothetical protein
MDPQPTADKIHWILEQMPHLYRVAFAARSASRVANFANVSDVVPSTAHSEATRGLRYAIQVARGSAHRDDTQVWFDRLQSASVGAPSEDPGFAALYAMYFAAIAASSQSDASAGLAANTSSLATTANLYANFDHPGHYRCELADALLLESHAARAGADDGTPIDPAALGPLWPNGEPDGWPEPVPPPGFRLAIDPGDADQGILQEVFEALSELHEVHTGYALTYTVDGALVRAEAGVPA